MMSSVSVMLLSLLGQLAAEEPAGEVKLDLDESRYRIEVPDFVLTDVPVTRITITAVDRDGNTDTSFNGRPLIQGIKLTVKGRDTALDRFRNGKLVLETKLGEGRRVYVVDSQIVVDPENRRRGTADVSRTLRWFAIVPPMLAIVLAIWLRNVIVALLAAVYSGSVILLHGNFFTGFTATLDTYLLNEIAQPGDAQQSHLSIILFTVFLGAMIGVMAGSGGTNALVGRLARFTQKREHGQLMTWFLGLVIFFDDYANSLLVGNTMRPITDKLRISREKLAFLVDSTAAPVAGLALVSTWVGFEVGLIEKAFVDLGIEQDAYTTFLATIPYRFYPLHLLVFVLLIAYSGRDYGPMLRAEIRALKQGELTRPGVTVPGLNDAHAAGEKARRQLLRNALIPIGVLLAFLVMGLWWTGLQGLEAANLSRAKLDTPLPDIPPTLWSILAHASFNRVMLLSSFSASLAAVACAVITRSLPLRESVDAWSQGAQSMFLAVMILVLAWSIATVCDTEHLNTAGFLVELCGGNLSPVWMPALAFVLAGLVSFSTGSSFSTMGLLIPLFISVTYYLLVDLNEADPNHPLLLGTIGGVLAGAIFGDHCSPISDTTVLSSAAAGSDHLDHVATQMPYAISVGAVSLLLGYLPVGFSYSPIVLLPLGLIVLYLLVQFLGRSVEECASDADPLGSADDMGLPMDLGDLLDDDL